MYVKTLRTYYETAHDIGYISVLFDFSHHCQCLKIGLELYEEVRTSRSVMQSRAKLRAAEASKGFSLTSFLDLKNTKRVDYQLLSTFYTQ